MSTVVEQLVALLEDKKCERIKALDMAQVTSLADYVTELMKAHNIALLRENGYRDGEWILQDFGDIIVHIFIPQEREYYDLDTMWADALLVASAGE